MINFLKRTLHAPLRQNAGERRQGKELIKSVVDLLERMKHGGGMKGLDDKSSGMEILMPKISTKSNPLTP